MVMGVFQLEEVNIAIASTGITGDESMDGIPPGTICIAWGFKEGKRINVYSETQLFKGGSREICQKAVSHALAQIKTYHQNFLNQSNPESVST